MLCVDGMGWDWDWMVIIGHRSSKSTFVANKPYRKIITLEISKMVEKNVKFILITSKH